jgi:multimeric flavodoxin WrbA
MRVVARLLIVHHTPSPATAELLDAVVLGASDPEITGVEVVRRAALAATAPDLLAADAVVLGTPANIGYMSGALKHFFDTVYYVCGDDTRGLPYGCYVHGNLGVEGAVGAVGSIGQGGAGGVLRAGGGRRRHRRARLSLGLRRRRTAGHPRRRGRGR